ncbi:MAG: hypothetical protein V1727_03685 [Candidatus Omnitrophota bacterium]
MRKNLFQLAVGLLICCFGAMAWAELAGFYGYAIDLPEAWVRHESYFNKSESAEELFPRITFMANELTTPLADYVIYIVDLLYAHAVVSELPKDAAINEISAMRFIVDFNHGQTWLRTETKYRGASRVLHYILALPEESTGKSYAYSIIFTDKSESFDQNVTEFEQILQSLAKAPEQQEPTEQTQQVEEVEETKEVEQLEPPGQTEQMEPAEQLEQTEQEEQPEQVDTDLGIEQ